MRNPAAESRTETKVCPTARRRSATTAARARQWHKDPTMKYTQAFDIAAEAARCAKQLGYKFRPGVVRAAAIAGCNEYLVWRDNRIAGKAMARTFEAFQENTRWDGSIA